MAASAISVARQTGTSTQRKAPELFDNTFAEHLNKSGFLRELWGGEVR